MGPLCRCECQAEENFLPGSVHSFCEVGVLSRDGAFNYANDESTMPSQCWPSTYWTLVRPSELRTRDCSCRLSSRTRTAEEVPTSQGFDGLPIEYLALGNKKRRGEVLHYSGESQLGVVARVSPSEG